MDLVHTLVTPPACFLLFVPLALPLWRRRPRLARVLLALSFVLLWATATPLCGGFLLRSLQVDAPLDPRAIPSADAIVVLAAGLLTEAPEFGGPTVDGLTLERVRYGAALRRATGLPLLVTGGPPDPSLPAVAELMRKTLVDEFDVPVDFVENRSMTTLENAALSAPLLKAASVKRILLVTHAWHLPRARRCFEGEGFEVVAAPTAFRAEQQLSVGAFLPSAKGLRDTAYAFHEWIGRAWYLLRGR